MSIQLNRTTVRAAAPEDQQAWRRLWDQYLTFLKAEVSDEMTAKTWVRILDPDRPDMFARLAEQNGAVVGFAVCVLHAGTWVPNPVCYLEDLCVDEAARGGGVGKALIDDLLALGAQHGWSRLYWHTEADNARARRLYDRYAGVGTAVGYRIPLD